MKVLQVNFSFSQGGAGLVSAALARSLTALGVEQRYYSAAGLHPDLPPPESQAQRLVRNLGWRPLRELGMGDTWYPWWMPGALRAAADWAEVISLHNLHGGFFNLRWLPRLAAQRPVVWSLHDDWLLTGHCAYPLDCERWRNGCGQCPYKRTYPAITVDSTARVHALKRALVRQAKPMLVFSSEWMKGRATQAGYAEADRRRAEYGLSEEWFVDFDRAAAKARLGLPADCLTILVALHEENRFKGGELLRQALPLVKPGSTPVRLLSVGVVRPDYYATSDLPVTYLGGLSAEAFRGALQAADLLVVPSIADSSPVVIRQALAVGTPVVAFAVGGIPELVSDSGGGLLATPQAPVELAAQLSVLIGDREQRRRLAEQGRTYARAHYPLTACGQWYLDRFRELTN